MVKKLFCLSFVFFVFGLFVNSYIYSQNITEYPIPAISISIDDAIDKENAPFKIQVKGTASNINNLYVYLVVVDNGVEWIQPKLSWVTSTDVTKRFEGYCYLGEINNPASLNKMYKIFAIVTDRKYKEYKHPDKRTIRANSKEIELFRVP